MDKLHFVRESVDIWVFLPFVAIMNNATVNIHVHVFAWTHVFISLACTPRSEIAGSYP